MVLHPARPGQRKYSNPGGVPVTDPTRCHLSPLIKVSGSSVLSENSLRHIMKCEWGEYRFSKLM